MAPLQESPCGNERQLVPRHNRRWMTPGVFPYGKSDRRCCTCCARYMPPNGILHAHARLPRKEVHRVSMTTEITMKRITEHNTCKIQTLRAGAKDLGKNILLACRSGGLITEATGAAPGVVFWSVNAPFLSHITKIDTDVAKISQRQRPARRSCRSRLGACTVSQRR